LNFILTLLLSLPPSADPTSPWQDLTPPEDLSGWQVCCGTATYTVKDGVVTGTTVPGSPNTFLVTERKYGDFEFEYEFKVDSKLNAGVQIRSEVNKNRMQGCQIEIDMDDERKRFWTAGIFEEGDRGWLCDLSKNPQAIAAHDIDEWNHVRVIAKGALIETWLNGVPAAKTYCGNRLQGVIGLQVHGVGAGQTEPLQVRWRKLKIRDLGRHHWIPFQKNAESKSTEESKDEDLRQLQLSLPAGASSLKLVFDSAVEKSFQADLGQFQFSAQPGGSYTFQLPPPLTDGIDDSMGSFGGGGSGSSNHGHHPWKDSTIYLHHGRWGSGFEIFSANTGFKPRQMMIFSRQSPAIEREFTLSHSLETRWRVQILVPENNVKTPQSGK